MANAQLVEQNTEYVDSLRYAGQEFDDGEDLSSLDRGDALPGDEPAPEPAAAATPAEAAPEAKPEEEPATEAAAEPVAEAEPEAEPKPAAEAKPTGEETKPIPNMIPRDRFNEVNERRKAAEAQAREMQAELERLRNPSGTPEEKAFDFDSAEERYMNAVVDGKFDDAKVIRAEIRRAEQSEYMRTAQQTEQNAVRQTQEQLEVQQAVRELEEQYPQLNVNSPDTYDQEATSEVLELQRGLIATGNLSPAVALRRAARLVAAERGFGSYAATPASPVAAAEPEPAPPPAPAQRQRAVSAAERQASAAAAQPRMPSGGAPSSEASRPPPSKLSDEAFEQLTEQDKARLRGDFV